MPLVYVDKHSKPEEPRTESIQTSEEQLKNAQISKYTVVRQDLEIAISASGRLLSSRQVSFQIYESDLPSVKPGSLFTGVPSVFSGQSFKGKITRVDTLVDPSSRTVRVEGTLDRPLTGVTSESGFQGEISNTLKNQIVVPESAVLHAGARELVYVFSAGNKLEPREVALGQKGQSQYQILSGLQAGEIISSGPNFLIDSEAKLRGQ
jgi:Cu(I)/Ag(I) efflux system membrane fusion protein